MAPAGTTTATISIRPPPADRTNSRARHNRPSVALQDCGELIGAGQRRSRRSCARNSAFSASTALHTAASSFDTPTAAHDLESADLDKRQAEAIVGAIRSGQGDLATKSDVGAVKSGIDSVRSELAVIRWVLGVQAAITLATLAIVAAKLL